MRQKEILIKQLAAGDAEDTGASFEGYLSTYGNEDRDGDVIVKGAFEKYLEKKSTVPLCFNHNWNSVIGKLELTSDDTGLKAMGYLNGSDSLAANIHNLIKMGALDSMSVGMYIKEYEPIDNKHPFGAWRITEAEAVEGSVVTIPANEMAAIDSVKALTDEERNELMCLRAEKRINKIYAILNDAEDRLK
jgi:HK97 family phage prohead protease